MATKIAIFQLSSCWGCQESLLDLYEKLVPILPSLDIKYWCAVIDMKKQSLKEIPNAGIDVSFVEGMCRTEDDVELLKLAREKSKLLLAFGTCSTYGGIPALANMFEKDELLRRKYTEAESIAEGTIPTVNLPKISPFVVKNDQIVKVDLKLPGCPPTTDNIAKAVTSLLQGQAPTLETKAVCDECKREKEEKIHVTEFKRSFVGIIDSKKCLLSQGYLCMGPGTRAGCGSQCPNANALCNGCYGPIDGRADQGAKLMSAIASIVDMPTEKLSESIKDVVGTFYKFTLPSALIPLSVKAGKRR